MNEVREERVVLDSPAFRGVEITTTYEDGTICKEHGLTWLLSPEETIKELQRIYSQQVK